MELNELTKAGLSGWPLVVAAVGIAICFVSFFIGWPWKGIIHTTYICKCKKNCPCKEHDDEDEDE